MNQTNQPVFGTNEKKPKTDFMSAFYAGLCGEEPPVGVATTDVTVPNLYPATDFSPVKNNDTNE